MTKILMCSPDYFEVSYVINPWMTDHIGKVDTKLAKKQWLILYNELKKFAQVELIHSYPKLPDMVFTANAGLVIERKAVLSRFAKSPRRGEEQCFAMYFYKNGYEIYQPNEYYEGEGDHLIDNQGRHWMGYGFRTNEAVVTEITQYLNLKITNVKLVDDRWYHLDTAFCPLPKGELLWYPPAFSSDSQFLIRNEFDNIIEVSESDALKFACNCICIENNLFMPSGTEIAEVLRHLNYNVYEFELSEFIKSGGAVKCLTLLLDH